MHINGPHGVTVGILDLETSDRGSKPREGSFFTRNKSLHQSNQYWVARIMHRMHCADIWPRGPMDKASLTKPAIAGSGPAWVICQRLRLAVLLLCPFCLALEAGLRLKKSWGRGNDPLHVSMPRKLKSRPSTSATHPSC